MQTDRTNNPKYLNWIKTSLSLLYLKEGLQDFCYVQANRLHQQIQQRVDAKRAGAACNQCTGCTCDNIKKTKVKHSRDNGWIIKCSNNVCNVWLDEILVHHEKLPCPKVEWSNCKPQLWPTHPWEIAKVFQPYGCERHYGASESDCTALMTMMLDCNFYNNLLSCKHLLRVVKDCRNKTMHSGNLEIDDVSMTSYLDMMIAILEDPVHLIRQVECKEAVLKIKQLRDNPLDLSLNKELELRALAQRMAVLELNIHHLQEQSDSLRSDLSEIATDQQQFADEQELTQDKLELLETDICQLQGECETLTTTLSSFDLPDLTTIVSDLSVLTPQLQTLAEQNKETARQLTERVKHVEGKLQIVQSHVDNLQTEIPPLKSLSDNLHNIEYKHNTLDNKVVLVNEKAQSIDNKVDTLARKVNTVNSRLGMIDNTNDKLEKDIDKIENKLEIVDTKVEHVVSNLDAMASESTLMSSTIDEMGAKIEETNRAVDDIRMEIENICLSATDPLSSQMETVLSRLENTETDIVKLAESRKHENTKSNFQSDEVNQLQRHLISLYNRHCQKVPIYPFKPNWKTKVKDMFVTPSMKVVDPRGKVKDAESEDVYVGRQFKTDVDHIDDIFIADGKPCRDIYISGDAGVGKSTLCEHLVNVWCQCHSQEDNDLSERGEVMANIPILFYISLRNVDRSLADYDHVETMAKSQLQLHDVDFSKLLFECDVMFLLDGLDELAPNENATDTRFQVIHLPRRRHSDRCTIVTTSRPWKLEVIGPELEGNIDRQIRITGLRRKSHEALTKKVINLLNSEYKKDKSHSDFYTEIRDKRLTKYLETPVLLTQMIGLWFSGTPLGNSQCEVYINMIDKQLQFAEEIRARPGTSSDYTCSTKHTNIPCLSDKPYCLKQQHLLVKLGKVAFEGLFGENRENSLVFDHKQTEICGMSANEVQESMNIGLLTQSRLFGEITEELKSVSFIHKTHQEFFAALYLANCFQSDASASHSIFNIFNTHIAKKSDLDSLLSSRLGDLDSWLEQEKVLTFVSGMNLEIASKMSQHFMGRVAEDCRIQEYRSASENLDSQTILVKRIQKLIFDCWIEAMRNGFDCANFQLDDFYLDHYNFEAICRAKLDSSNARSVVLQTIENITHNEKERCKSILRSCCLQKVCVYDWGGIIQEDVVYESVRGSHHTLEVLCLSNIKVPSSVSKCTSIFSAPNLTVLHIREVSLSHAQLSSLLNKISKAKCLRELYLRRVECSSHHYGVSCDFYLQLPQSTLQRLELVELVPEIKVRGSNVLPFESIKKVWLGWLTISTEAFRMLMDRLPESGTKVNLEEMTVNGTGAFYTVTCIRVDSNNEMSEDYTGLCTDTICRITHISFQKKGRATDK